MTKPITCAAGMICYEMGHFEMGHFECLPEFKGIKVWEGEDW